MSFESNMMICQTCPYKLWHEGDLTCKLTKRLQIDHAQEGSCPKKFYNEAGKLAERVPLAPVINFQVLWYELHNRPFKFKDVNNEMSWLRRFAGYLPCGDCRHHYLEMIKEVKPDFSSRLNYARTTWIWHNIVNKRLSKPEYSWEAASTLYKYAQL